MTLNPQSLTLWLQVDESCSIDIPDFYIATKQYCATLAHKVAITL